MDIQSIGAMCTDGAPAMLGNKSGSIALMKQKIPHLQGIHGFLHRHTLASNASTTKLKKVLDFFFSTINWIRGYALNHRLIKSLCEDV